MMVYVDGAVMVTATVVMFWFLASHARLTRVEGAVMLCAYISYVAARYTYALA